jgi:nicotinate-nucleotide adenylyltransferase
VARTALFGGSFNPIHCGHLILAEDVREALALDRVLFMPAAVPPHKPRQQLAAAADRFAMVALATQGHPAFAVSDLELRRPGPSYTVDTVEALRAASADELFVLVGSETFLDLLSWKDAPRLARLARLVVVPRTGSTFDPDSVQAVKVLREIGQGRFVHAGDPLPPDGVLVVHAASLPISASDLRRRARDGRSLAYRMPDAVVAYIRARQLYRD